MRSLALVALLAGCSGPPEWPEEARLDLGEVTSSRIVVTWPAADGAEAYLVRIDGEPAARLGADARSYAADGLADVSEHTIEVEAIDAAGRSSSTLRRSATTLDATAPAFGEGATLTLSAGESAEASNVRDVELTWPAATDNVAVARYRVLSGREEAATVDAPALSARLEDVALVDGASFEVRALDAAGNESPPLAARYAAPAPREDPALAAAERRLLESMLLGSLGESGAFADVLAGAAVTGSSADVLEQAQGIGVARAEPPPSGGGGGGLGSLGAMRAHGPRVDVGAARSAGGAGTLDPAMVTRMLRVRAPALRRCYEEELRARPSLAGSLTARFTVGPGGAVDAAEATAGLDPALDACVLGVLRRLRFSPGPEGGPAAYETTLAFRPS